MSAPGPYPTPAFVCACAKSAPSAPSPLPEGRGLDYLRCSNVQLHTQLLAAWLFQQAHKIPGTMCSQPRPVSDHGCASASSLAGWEPENADDGSADSTFKTKMEHLSDKTSTNLHIEGLPLSIDQTANTRVRRSRREELKNHLSIPPPPLREGAARATSRINAGMHDDLHSDAGLAYTRFELDYPAILSLHESLNASGAGTRAVSDGAAAANADTAGAPACAFPCFRAPVESRA
ncbi:hypothetical protein DFH07DRAFT_957407 [Mycena maculata]|uniref:Uncharacterized protein n=1 Tax=Mycena maculata TaxID=230809 RepID=A0AAD7NG57_9AGAR|nr:hypothetical protein DFH07DRAFT_957407 [Mycena maculata]